MFHSLVGFPLDIPQTHRLLDIFYLTWQTWGGYIVYKNPQHCNMHFLFESNLCIFIYIYVFTYKVYLTSVFETPFPDLDRKRRRLQSILHSWRHSIPAKMDSWGSG